MKLKVNQLRNIVVAMLCLSLVQCGGGKPEVLKSGFVSYENRNKVKLEKGIPNTVYTRHRLTTDFGTENIGGLVEQTDDEGNFYLTITDPSHGYRFLYKGEDGIYTYANRNDVKRLNMGNYVKGKSLPVIKFEQDSIWSLKNKRNSDSYDDKRINAEIRDHGLLSVKGFNRQPEDEFDGIVDNITIHFNSDISEMKPKQQKIIRWTVRLSNSEVVDVICIAESLTSRVSFNSIYFFYFVIVPETGVYDIRFLEHTRYKYN